mmetsp:Transcript_24353/g.70065  ORF Transcript_24353/g.70065 Transcript_24353/m.70065 type:complete len:123 (-) Transcript_24353:1394-1762(-)
MYGRGSGRSSTTIKHMKHDIALSVSQCLMLDDKSSIIPRYRSTTKAETSRITTREMNNTDIFKYWQIYALMIGMTRRAMAELMASSPCNVPCGLFPQTLEKSPTTDVSLTGNPRAKMKKNPE